MCFVVVGGRPQIDIATIAKKSTKKYTHTIPKGMENPERGLLVARKPPEKWR